MDGGLLCASVLVITIRMMWLWKCYLETWLNWSLTKHDVQNMHVDFKVVLHLYTSKKCHFQESLCISQAYGQKTSSWLIPGIFSVCLCVCFPVGADGAGFLGPRAKELSKKRLSL